MRDDLESLVKQKNKISKLQKSIQGVLDDIYDGHSIFYEQLGETILNLVVKDCGIEEFVSGKEEFFLYFGKVFSDDVFYKERMEYFINYFLFDRILSKYQISPFEKYFDQALSKQPKEQQDIWSRFYQWNHSVWMVERVSKGTVFIKDLILDQIQAVDLMDEKSFFGVKKKDIFQGTLLFFSNLCVIKNGIIIHPSCASESICKFIQNGKLENNNQNLNKLDKLKILGRLAACCLQATRSKTLDPRVLYSKLV